jgi:hypothetical protein
MRCGFARAFVAIALVAGIARAEDEHSSARLELRAPTGANSCIEKNELEADVERRLRRTVFREPAELIVDVRVERETNGWAAELVLYDTERRELGRRSLDSPAPECSDLDASLALVVALLVDAPPAPPPEATPEPAPPTAAAVPPAPKPAPPTPSKPPTERRAPSEPWRFVPMLSVFGAYDRIPGFAFGPRAGVVFLPQRFPEFRVSVGALLPREETIGSEEAGGRFWLLDAAFELCPLGHHDASLRVSGCVGPSVGRLAVSGIGFDENDEVAAIDIVLSAGILSFVRLAGRFGLIVGVGGGVPLTRNSYSAKLADGERVEVWQRGFFVASGEVGAGLEL